MSQNVMMIIPQKDIDNLVHVLYTQICDKGVYLGEPVYSNLYIARRVFLPPGYHCDVFAQVLTNVSPNTAVYGGIIPQDDIKAYDGLSRALEGWNSDKIAGECMIGEGFPYR